MPNAPQLVTADRLEHLLQERSEMQSRARTTPREVFAQWLENFGAGVGVGVVALVILWLLRAPESWLYSAPLAVSGLAFGALMFWRGTLDERQDSRNQRAVRRTVQAMQRECDNQVRTLRRQLDTAFDEIETLERSLDQAASERDMALADLGRERQIAQAGQRRTTYVPMEPAQPQDVRDANEMIRFYFDRGSHLSRRRAADDKRWSAERHAAAQGLLVRAGVLAVNATQPVMLAQTLSDALGKLNTYLVHARSVQAPPIVQQANDYVESE